MPDFLFEQQARLGGAHIICGVDEVGRGPLAGPVMAAAVIIPVDRDGRPDLPLSLLSRLNDSKKISAKQREAIFPSLVDSVPHGIGIIPPDEIDRINILQATFAAMVKAVEALPTRPDYALIDGNKVPPNLPCRGTPIIKGDSKSLSIAAASIMAKVLRDRTMAQLAMEHPGYGWDRNAGYGTAEHRTAIAQLGLTPHHRRSFAGCR
ncbi:MAG: ribonuclease HII [Pseudomonadota bacterium]